MAHEERVYENACGSPYKKCNDSVTTPSAIKALGAAIQAANNEKEDMSNINYQKETMHC